MNLWEYPIRVAGISYYVSDMADIITDHVWCERISDHPFDSFAIAVYITNCGINGNSKRQIGFLPKEISKHILDDELPCRGKVVWYSNDRYYPGIRIEI